MSRIWTGWRIGDDKDAFCGLILFLVAVAAIYCINLLNVELFAHRCFHTELVNFDHVRQKNGLPL